MEQSRERMSGGKQGKRARQDRINAEWAALARACKGCAYFTASRCCDYIGIVGHRRPCPPGPECTVKTKEDRRRKVDYGKVEDLYRRRKTDKEIAAIVGCGVSTVARWRHMNGMKANPEGGKDRGANRH